MVSLHLLKARQVAILYLNLLLDPLKRFKINGVNKVNRNYLHIFSICQQISRMELKFKNHKVEAIYPIRILFSHENQKKKNSVSLFL